MNRKTIIGLLAAASLCVGAALSATAALTLAVGAGGSASDHILGEVIPTLNGQSGGLDVRDALMINNLLAMDLGTRTADGVTPEYYRASTDYATLYGTLPAATSAGAVLAQGVGTSIGQAHVYSADPNYILIQLSSTTSYKYLVGAWDGKNSGVEVWYVGNVAPGTEILIPRYAYPVPDSGKDAGDVWPQNLVANFSGTAHELTSWGLYNPVPEPTTMIAGALLLLPFGASTVRFIRKKRAA